MRVKTDWIKSLPMNFEEIEMDTTGLSLENLSINVAENVYLKVIHIYPDEPRFNVPMIFIPGLATTFKSFQKVITFLAKHIPLFYIETREKRSSRIEGKVSFGIEVQSIDLKKIIEYFDFKDNEYFVMGFSYGASIVAHSYKDLKNKPAGIIFIEPTPEFHYPKWSLIWIRFSGARLYNLTKPFAKWYIRNFHVNKKEDKEMAEISSKALDNADPKKLSQTVLDIAHYKVWDQLPNINCKSLVVGTSKDGFHNKDEILRMNKMIKDSEFLDLETNYRTHSQEMGETAINFFSKTIL